MEKIYLLEGKRTPFAAFGGMMREESPTSLAGMAYAGFRENLPYDHVVFANVIPSFPNALYAARHFALNCGLPLETPAYNINRLCGSGFQAVSEAMHLIQLKRAQTVLVGAAENMSAAPHCVYGARFGTKYGALKTKDLLFDALTDERANIPMAITAENLAKEYGISRGDCDAFSVASHRKAADHDFSPEIVPYEGRKKSLSLDENIRQEIDEEKIAKLKPSFQAEGTVTPATASGIVDGGAALSVVSAEYLMAHQLSPLAEIVDYQVVGVDPQIMGIGPVPAIQTLLQKQNLSLGDIGVMEINEAFAAQALACARALKWEEEKLNCWGGSIAIGHPLAVTGARLLLTTALQMKSFGSEYGVASACIGGGQGIAFLLKSCP